MQKISGRQLTLRDFSLMKKRSSVFYAENFGLEDCGFGKVLVPKHYGEKFVDDLSLVDSYSESNQDVIRNLKPGDATQMGQTFTALAGTLDSCKFYLRKWLAPTGNATVTIYAHTGTFGTDGKPTGAALATSDNFDITTLTGTLQLITFNFTGTDRVDLTGGTKYCIVVEYTGGDGSNFLQIGVDSSSPTHSGNLCYYISPNWSSLSEDVCFYVYINLKNNAGNALRVISGMDAFTNSVRYLFMIDELSNIWFSKASAPEGYKIKNINQSCAYPDIAMTKVSQDNRVYFSTKDKVGRIHRGAATGGSTTTLVDTAATFLTDGVAAGDAVYNEKDNVIATVDAGGITETTLTITFSPVGGSFSAGEWYSVIDSDWESLTDDNATYGRQIIEFAGNHYILDGEYLAVIDDSGVFGAAHKILELNWIARCGASNGNLIAIGCNKNNKGKIFFWDEVYDGWKNIIAVNDEIYSIVAYGNNFIFASGRGIYLTDGYSVKLLSFLPGSEESDTLDVVKVRPKGLAIIEGNVILNGGIRNPNKAKHGIWIYNIARDEWAYSPYDSMTDEEKSGYLTSSGIVFWDSKENDIYYSFSQDDFQGWNAQRILSKFKLGQHGTRGCVIFNPIPLGKNARLKKIEVNLTPSLRNYINASGKSKTVECRLSNCKKPVWRYQYSNQNSSALNKLRVAGDNTSYADAVKGDQIMIQDGHNGFLRREITNIDNDGTATEEWTLDSDLPELIKNQTTITVMPFQLYGMTAKTITEETEMLEFYPSFYGDNVMIELYVIGSKYPILNIESVKLFYE